jgi:hypothetical protein
LTDVSSSPVGLRELRDPFAADLLETAGNRLRLTGKGVLLSNEVFRAFVD